MDTIYRELRDIVSRLAAKNLTGRWCVIHYKKPPLGGCKGLAFRDNAENIGVVYVDPDLDDDELLRVTLHEFGHIRKHYDIMVDIGNVKRLAQYHVRDIQDRIPESKENEVKALTGKWVDLANRLKPNGDYLQRLNALSSHYSGRK